MDKKRITLKDVAAAAGLSFTTVSRALRGDRLIAEETRERVKALAAQLGYRPNPAFSMLSSRMHRDPMVVKGLPLAFITDIKGDQKFGAADRGLKSASARAAELGYEIKHYDLRSVTNLNGFTRNLYHRGVAGVIISYNDDTERLQALDWSYFPVVCAGTEAGQLPFNTVRSSDFQTVYYALCQMHRMGYRRIGAAIHQHRKPFYSDNARLAAVLLYQQTLGLECRPPLPAPLLTQPQDNSQTMDWYRREKPDAILAFGVADYWVLKMGGITIPETVGLAALHITPGAPEFAPLAGILSNTHRVFTEAVNLIDQQIRFLQSGAQKHTFDIVVNPLWHDGPSLPIKA